MNYLRGLILFGVLFTLGDAQSQSQVDALDDEFDALDKKLEAEFKSTDQSLEQRFLLVKDAVDKAYKGLSEKISVNWGADVKLPTRKTWVTYDDSFETRVELDFEAGTYRVETILEGDIAQSLFSLKSLAIQIALSNGAELRAADVFNKEIQQTLQANSFVAEQTRLELISKNQHINAPEILPINVVELIDSLNLDQVKSLQNVPNPRGPAPPIVSKEPKFKVPDVMTIPLLATDISSESISGAAPRFEEKLSQSNSDIEDNIAITKQKRASSNSQELPNPVSGITPITAKKNSNLLAPKLEVTGTPELAKLVLTIPFVNNYQKILFRDKLQTVKDLAQKYNIDTSLILAVIEAESSFNPMATSAIPAFGLMQVVPNTAAVDSYQFLYGKRHIVSPEFLYNEDNNLLFGTTYLHILSSRYLRGIEDSQSKMYCILASYNTGVGNLSKTFVQQKNLKKAVSKINTMSSKQTYDHLMANLPADETKRYIQKILARKQYYYDSGL